MRTCQHRPESLQNFDNTIADQKVRLSKTVKAQEDKAQVRCEQDTLKNVFLFKYLGSVFAADGSRKPTA